MFYSNEVFLSMLEDNLLLILSLLFASSMLAMLSRKLGISYPIFLVIAGLIIGFVPGIPHIVLHPDLVFLIFLPPLLYSGAWNASWKDLWKLRRPISLLAFGLVIFNSAAIAFLAHGIIPDFSLAMGFLLGGIISPPDAISATSILKGLKVPRRVITTLEGESLINDASSLIVFRFATAAILTGRFSFWEASGDFFLVVVMGIAIGLAIGLIVYIVHRYFPTTPSIDIPITIITPYLMYITAEQFEFSGVLAVVSGGLFLSYRSNKMFSYRTRIQAYPFWESLVFMLNCIVFILIGLQLPTVVDELNEDINSAVWYSVIISFVTIIVRILWVYSNTYLPRWASKRIRRTRKRPSPGTVFLVAWSGMRGVVSLAAALAIPLTLLDGQDFPHRSLILFITFNVILVTLILQGLSLPMLIRVLNIKDDLEENSKSHDMKIKLRFATAVLEHIKAEYRDELQNSEAIGRLKANYEKMIETASKQLYEGESVKSLDGFLPRYQQILKDIITVRRAELQKLREERIYPEDLLRDKEWDLDLEEARLSG